MDPSGPPGMAESGRGRASDPPAWPTRRAMFSMGTPESESSETKLCRSSRGVHSSAMPAFLQIVRSDRRTSESVNVNEAPSRGSY